MLNDPPVKRLDRPHVLSSIYAYILEENLETQALMRKVGFRLTVQPDDPSVLFAELVHRIQRRRASRYPYKESTPRPPPVFAHQADNKYEFVCAP